MATTVVQSNTNNGLSTIQQFLTTMQASNLPTSYSSLKLILQAAPASVHQSLEQLVTISKEIPTGKCLAFFKFQSLPIELRLKIFDEAASKPGGYIIAFATTFTKDETLYAKIKPHTYKPHPLLHVCKEARKHLMSNVFKFMKELKTPNLDITIYMDNRQVLIFVDLLKWYRIWANATTKVQKAKAVNILNLCFKGVERLGLQHYGSEILFYSNATSHVNKRVAWLHKTFPDLEEIMLLQPRDPTYEDDVNNFGFSHLLFSGYPLKITSKKVVEGPWENFQRIRDALREQYGRKVEVKEASVKLRNSKAKA